MVMNEYGLFVSCQFSGVVCIKYNIFLISQGNVISFTHYTLAYYMDNKHAENIFKIMLLLSIRAESILCILAPFGWLKVSYCDGSLPVV